jgi:TatD DNase family protein
MPILFDTHAHLNDRRLKGDISGTLARARESGVERVICAGYDIESSRLAVKIAEEHPNVWATVGIHPHDAKTLNNELLAELSELAARPKVVAIGEIGLLGPRGMVVVVIQADFADCDDFRACGKL